MSIEFCLIYQIFGFFFTRSTVREKLLEVILERLDYSNGIIFKTNSSVMKTHKKA